MTIVKLTPEQQPLAFPILEKAGIVSIQITVAVKDDMTEETITLLKEAGCYVINIVK